MPSPHALKHASDVITFIQDSSLPARALSTSHNEKGIRPLWFSRVSEGVNPASKTSFFCLPSELLDHITGLLSTSDLASFALVNSACRQLSRTRQFASVRLDYSSAGPQGIWNILANEAADRIKNHGHPSLGVCIRSLTIASVIPMPPLFVAWWKGRELSVLFGSEKMRQQAVETRAKEYFDTYVKEIGNALIDALPSLEILRWEDRVHITPELMAAISRSNVRELKLCGVFVDREFEVDVPAEEQKWKLRNLELEVLHSESNAKVSAVPLCMSILRAAAATLEHLEWTNVDASAFDISSLRFPHIRSLLLEKARLPDSLLSALIPPDSPQLRLRSLSISSASASEYLYHRGHIDSLRTYHTPIVIPPTTIPFITANPQIHTFTAPHANTPLLLNTQLLPVLANFRHLSSLHLVWGSTSINALALETIGRITTLVHLWISAGAQTGDINDWIIDHPALTTALSPLQKLRVLVFTRDTYVHPLTEILPRDYYTLRRPPQSVGEEELPGEGSVEEREAVAWEAWHNDEMRKIAHEYGEVLKRLEWIFLGQVEARVRVCCGVEAHGRRYKEGYHAEDGGVVYGKPLEWWRSEKRVEGWCFGKAGGWESESWLPGDGGVERSVTGTR